MIREADVDRPWLSNRPSGPELLAVESFCGPGGMALGLHQAGFDVAYAFDYNEQAVKTHLLNLPGQCEVRDAAEISPEEILERIGVERGELALWSGGPPCQGFSKQKRGAHLGDSATRLFRRT